DCRCAFNSRKDWINSSLSIIANLYLIPHPNPPCLYHSCIHPRPTRMLLLQDAIGVAVSERLNNGRAGRCVFRDLNQQLGAELQSHARHNLIPIEVSQRDVLADRAREDGMAFGLQGEDAFEGVEA